MARVVDAEDGPRGRIAIASKVADLRIVAVDDESRIGRKLVYRGPPAPGDELELAVAVELVAEEVSEAQGPRSQPPCDFGQGRLVHLEQPQPGVPRRQQARGDPRDEGPPATVAAHAGATR